MNKNIIQGYFIILNSKDISVVLLFLKTLFISIKYIHDEMKVNEGEFEKKNL